MLSQSGGCREDVGGDDSKHVNGKINYQLQKFTPLGLMSWATVLYFAPRGEREKRRGAMPLGLFLFISFMVTCPRPPVFARPNKYSSCLSLHRQGFLSWVTVTYFTPRGKGEQRQGLMPLGLFLFIFSHGHLPRPPVFALPNKSLSQTSALPLGSYPQDRNIFCTQRGGRITAGSNAPRAFLVFFLWSLAADSWFSLGQTNICRKLPLNNLGSYLE